MPYSNKADQAKAAKRHYEANKSIYKLRASKAKIRHRERNRLFVVSYLQSHPCVDCNEADPVVLEFDHVRGDKEKEISRIVNWPKGISAIKSEIAKCEVRCANCHRRKTAKTKILNR